MRLHLPLLLAVLAGPASAQDLPVAQLSAGMYLIRAEVAADFGSRAQGLMYRKEMPSNAGMLFVFEAASQHCMWMKNTLIPLSVAFIGADGTIVNIEDMKPRDESTHCAKRSVPYALEMERGWFASRGIKPGQKIGGLEGAPPPK